MTIEIDLRIQFSVVSTSTSSMMYKSREKTVPDVMVKVYIIRTYFNGIWSEQEFTTPEAALAEGEKLMRLWCNTFIEQQNIRKRKDKERIIN